jgi:hypothetical protein
MSGLTTLKISAAPAVAALLLLALACLTTDVAAQPGKSGAAQPGAGAAATAPVAKPALSKPLWRELTLRQQRALEPLAANWDELTEAHKLKWLAMSRNYAELSPTEQETLHSRMTDWSRLSNQQREQARQNFAAVKQVPPDVRKAKWEAYQALSEEEKRQLAANAKPAQAPGAAAPLRPGSQKFAPVPVALDGKPGPRIQLAPPAKATPSIAPATVSEARPSGISPATSSAPVLPEAQVPTPPAPP